MAVDEQNLFVRAVRRCNRRLLTYNLPFVVYFAAFIVMARLGYDLDHFAKTGNTVMLVFFCVGMLMALPALVAGWNMVKWVRRKLDPGKHPSFAVFGAGGRLRGRSGEASEALLAGPFLLESDYVRMTDEWIATFDKWGFEVHRLEDVVWIFTTEYTETVNAVVEVAHEDGFALKTIGGDTVSVSMGSQEAAASILDEIEARVPWAVRGYSDELQQAWLYAREDFLAKVAARRESGGG